MGLFGGAVFFGGALFLMVFLVRFFFGACW